MNITVKSVETESELQSCFAIRFEVFVEEQKVPREEELDEHESTARHYLALHDGQPVGTCRWRKTLDGIKMERFAVRASHRKGGVGRALLQAALADVLAFPQYRHAKIYLHAQVQAERFYFRNNFVSVGELFQEAGIDHYKMVYNKGHRQ